MATLCWFESGQGHQFLDQFASTCDFTRRRGLAQYAFAIAPSHCFGVDKLIAMAAQSRPMSRAYSAATKARHAMVKLPTVLAAALAMLALHSPVQAAEDYPSKPTPSWSRWRPAPAWTR